MDDCIFCKIARKEISKEFIYEDEDVMVFPDIHPIKPVHLLVVTKKHISEFAAIEDSSLFEKVFSIVKKMIKDNNLENKGHRIIINGGGAQIIDHLHVHLISPIGKESSSI
jgi:histidine triad (HIT) family protein